MPNTPASTHIHPRHRAIRAAGVAACFFLTGVSALAHDLWIEPSAFLPEAGKLIGVKLRVGVDLLGDPVPRDPAVIERFVAADRAGIKPIAGRDGEDPAGLLRLTSPGLVVLGYASAPSRIVLPAKKFNDYLVEEGLESVAVLRAKRNQTNAEASESFARCAKSLISSGPVSAQDSDRVLGFTLELVAERNPYALHAGQSLPVRLVYRDKPLAGALIIAVNRRDPSAKLSARSGKDGRATFKLTEPGMWLIKAVHMTAAADGEPSQWNSYWASLTFELPNTAATLPAPR